MRGVSGKVVGVVALAVLLLVLGTLVVFAQEGVLNAPPRTFALVQGWYQGRQTFYYDFGSNSGVTNEGARVAVAPIYVPVTGVDAQGNPQTIEGQYNIIDVLPGNPGYSDLWQVVLVGVPQGYQVNALTSYQQVQASGYPMTTTETTVNCPVVPAGSSLAEGGAPLVQGWYREQEVFYFDFGTNPTATAPIYVLTTGMDAQGNPQIIQGQGNIIDVIPGDAGYSDFWRVNLVTVPAGYQANSITSASQLLQANYPMTRTAQVVNCPVLRTAETAAQPGQLPQTGGPSGSASFWLILLGVAVLGAGWIVTMSARRA